MRARLSIRRFLRVTSWRGTVSFFPPIVMVVPGKPMGTPAASLTGKTLLLIDPSEEYLAGLRTFFEQKGNVVLTVSTGTTALELFRVKEIDAVILDYNFPDMTAERIATE